MEAEPLHPDDAPTGILYNDIDPFCCEWLRRLMAADLIPRGDVWCRSITEIQPHELEPYHTFHAFAGLGGWAYALRLAGWDDSRPVSTCSCPCQPLSRPGKRRGHLDERHLWPEYHRLTQKRRFPVIFGEQVESEDGVEWLDGVSLDLEELGYTVGAGDLPAAGVNAPHRRQRIFWSAHADGAGMEGLRIHPGAAGQTGPWGAYSQMALLASGGLAGGAGWPQPLVRVLDDGIPGAMELLNGYGNAIVPQVAAAFIEAAVGAMQDMEGTGK